MNKMKIVLITPPIFRESYGVFAEAGGKNAPLGILYLAAVLEKNNFVTPILYLLNVTPEDIFIRINTDPRDRNKEYVSRKINEIQEHYYQEKQTFYNFISFINSITPVFHREINFGEGELETHVREILEDLCQRRIA